MALEEIGERGINMKTKRIITVKHPEDHGMRDSITYDSWRGMKERCLNPKHKNYRTYAKEGITVCQEWIESFSTFLSDMGERPSREYSIDRIDNSKGYFKENCRWATVKEQHRNHSRNILLTYCGETLCITDWCTALEVPKHTMLRRYHRGCSIEEILESPYRKRIIQ